MTRLKVPPAGLGFLLLLLLLPMQIASAAPPEPGNIELFDRPNDDGTALLLTFDLDASDEDVRIGSEVLVDGEWFPANGTVRLAVAETKADLPEYFGWNPAAPQQFVLPVDRWVEMVPPSEEVLAENAAAPLVQQNNFFEAGGEYTVRLVVVDGGERINSAPFTAATHEEWFSMAAANNMVLCIIFAAIILGFIMAARKNPNLFIRRIQGLEAVDDAIGRATEMGRPVLHLNGLDPLSTLSTIAAVNILGRIAKRVANFESDLLVPCFDPVVMTVSQEVVKNAYLEAGRPDAFREENIYFLTDQQFSYVASVCGIMVRQKPAANFMLGYFYAESLMLAETGYTTGAIQIAGTDALSQLPFFITTCDYTLIGEELYAASAYLSREPMLLGSLKGQDVGKAFVMAIILLGSILATFGYDWLENLLTPLM